MDLYKPDSRRFPLVIEGDAMLACLTARVYSGLGFSLSGVGPNVAETQACVRGKNVAFILQVTEHLLGPQARVGTGSVL